MRIKAYFDNDEQKRDIKDRFGAWYYYETYNGNMQWKEEKDYYIVWGSAVCLIMAKELKKYSSRVEIEKFTKI